MTDNLKRLLHYFPTGTGEEEREILKEVFIEPHKFNEIIESPGGILKVLVGNKGVGKTVLLERIDIVAKSQKIPSLMLKPDDFTSADLEKVSDIANIKALLYNSIIRKLSSRLGTVLSGFLTKENARLHEQAIKEGLKEKDGVQKLLSVLSMIAKPLTSVDYQAIAAEFNPSLSTHKLALAIGSNLVSSSSNIFVLIDDTDQIAASGTPSHMNRIWGLLLACRKITNDCPNIKIYISLRREIWHQLTRDNRGQRDQIDHIRPLITDISADEALLRKVLDSRLEAASKAAGKAGLDKRLFFESDHVDLPGTEQRREWTDFIIKSSRDRPRDIIQFVNMLARIAIDCESDKITSSVAETAALAFSENRSEDLSVEFIDECGNLLEIIRKFSEINTRVPFEELRDFLKTIPSSFSITIRGRTIKPSDDDSALELLKFLHDVGFYNPRVFDSSQPKQFRHIVVGQDPRIVQRERWNFLQSCEWEIHPVFHSYLKNLKRQNELFRR